MQWVGSRVLRVITWLGPCVRGSCDGWGHVWGRPSDNGATHSGKGSMCSKLFVRQGFCGWPGWVKAIIRAQVLTCRFCLGEKLFEMLAITATILSFEQLPYPSSCFFQHCVIQRFAKTGRQKGVSLICSENTSEENGANRNKSGYSRKNKERKSEQIGRKRVTPFCRPQIGGSK